MHECTQCSGFVLMFAFILVVGSLEHLFGFTVYVTANILCLFDHLRVVAFDLKLVLSDKWLIFNNLH